MRLGLIGVGIVGNAFYEGMKHTFDIVRYDKNRKDVSDVNSIAEVVANTDGPIFICVPTPMNFNGSCNLDIVMDVISHIRAVVLSKVSMKTCSHCKGTGFVGGDFISRILQSVCPWTCQLCSYCAHGKIWSASQKRIVVIKSTVPPGTTEYFNSVFSDSLKLVFNPEFLTEANPVEDFKNQDRIFVGGPVDAATIVLEVYRQAYPDVHQQCSSSTAAELVKYVGNCFLATKVSFANEIYQICQKLNVDYNDVMSMATKDKRLGESHWKVPGHDGHFGFGLTCFPKDINALISLAKTLEVEPTILEAAWKKNLEVRPEKDWEDMKGRAVL